MGRGRLGGTTQMNSRNPEPWSSTPPAPKLFLRSFQTLSMAERNQISLQRTPTSKHKRLEDTSRAPGNSSSPPGLFMRSLRHYKQLYLCVCELYQERSKGAAQNQGNLAGKNTQTHRDEEMSSNPSSLLGERWDPSHVRDGNKKCPQHPLSFSLGLC